MWALGWEDRQVERCAPLVCGEFHAEPDFPRSCAGTEGTEANFGVARATDEARGVKVKHVTWGINGATRRALKLLNRNREMAGRLTLSVPGV